VNRWRATSTVSRWCCWRGTRLDGGLGLRGGGSIESLDPRIDKIDTQSRYNGLVY
jgi:hypothetical protein